MTEQNTIAIAELQQKANYGDAQAQFDLALCYANGTDIEKNLELAFEWHKKAAEQGHVNAQFALGLYYLYSPERLNIFNILFSKWASDRFTTKNVDPALDLALSQALSKALISANDDLAFLWLKNAAEQNHAEANYWLGMCYRDGIGIQQNDVLAFDSFKNAADQGLAESQYALACCYFEGKGVELNDELGLKWCQKSAHNGIPEAQYSLACRYLDGNGVAQNLELGLEWLSKAAQETHEIPEARMRLANCYAKSIGIKQSDEQAFQWFKKTIDYSTNEEITGEACYQVAKMYFEGRAVETNYKEGMEYLIEAIRNNHAEASQWLENTYMQFVFPYFMGREDIEQCYEFAFKWLIREFAHDPSDLEVIFGLGVLYAFGKGIDRNQEHAIEYFRACMRECESVYSDHENFTEVFYDFSELFIDISEDSIKKYYFDVLAPFFDKRKNIDVNLKQVFSVLPSLRINFHLRMNEVDLLKEFLNEFECSTSIFKMPSSKKNFKIMGFKAVEQSEDLAEKNIKLREAKNELEEMISMFAHKFRSPLDAIIYNNEHEKSVKLYKEAAQTMRGLLNVFSIISTDAAIFKNNLMADKQGNGKLITVFSKTLDMILLHLLSVSSREKIRQHYITYAKAHGYCEASISRKVWREEYFELEQRLQTEWEQSFANLLNQPAPLAERLAWLAQHFFTLELIGFESDDIVFEEYGVTESFLTIVLNEILVNAFKYYASDTKQSVTLEWTQRDGDQVLICGNPSFGLERTMHKGSQKGHTFLSTLARNIGSHFTKPVPQDNFVVEFRIPNELLIAKKAGES